jgi:predicted short-subunit dehydrogenase-like oxidoreductase (DUF2520 family)
VKPSNYKIVIIGAGNVATHLALALQKSGHTIAQVYSKRLSSAGSLAKMLRCASTDLIQNIDITADLYIVAIKDDAISEVAELLNLKNKIIVHTSGSVGMNVLKPASKNYGVFYPLQTFSKTSKVNFKTVPICLEANNTNTLNKLIAVAESISSNVQKINTEQRKTIHVAAVFACNFTNHLYAIADCLLAADNLSLDILKPLIEETAKKIKENSPANVQTGPAARNDKKTMDNQLQMLAKQKDYQQIYKLLSKSIMDFTKNKKQ